MGETDSFGLLDVEFADPDSPTASLPPGRTFARDGSPHDDAGGPRELVGVIDAAEYTVDDLMLEGEQIDVAGRMFTWASEGENQRSYAGETPDGYLIQMATLNVGQAVAIDLLTSLELVDGDLIFDGQAVPDGWIDTGALTATTTFLAGATGSATPSEGMRSLYGDPNVAENPSWDDIGVGFWVTLSTWPVTSSDPHSEARYNMDGEIETEVERADGSTAVGFRTAADDEFFEFVVWRDGSSWLALSRPASGGVDSLIDLATTVRVASPDDLQRLESLAAG